MSKKVKTLRIDLHTHPIEALREEMNIKGILDIDKKVAGKIVNAIKVKGLDGIAITEYRNFNHSYVACLKIMENFPKENLVILPGEEIDVGNQQILKLYIPPYITKSTHWFKGKEWYCILAHPGLYNPYNPADLGVELDAVEYRSKHGEFPLAYEIAKERNLQLIQTSDAHSLDDIGLFYEDIEFYRKK